MPLPVSGDRRSWWVGLSRADLQQAIRARESGWRAQQQKYLDHIGAQIVGYEPPRVRLKQPGSRHE